MSEAALSVMRPVIFSGIEKLCWTSRFSASRMFSTGAVEAAALADEAVDATVMIWAYMMPALESTAAPPILADAMELGNCARLLAKASRRYWPIIAQEPSAATPMRGSGLGEATTLEAAARK